MSKAKIILSIVAVLLVMGLFLLPKAVVENDATAVEENNDTPKAASGSSAENAGAEAHNTEIPSQGQNLLANLREKLDNSEDNKKNVIFADSLAAVFKSYQKLDSAAKYKAIAAELSPSKERLIDAGNTYYEAFTFAADPEKSQQLAEEARALYAKALTLSSGKEKLDIKAKVAMTYIASTNPMKGIGMLREVIEEDPEHEEAIFNLGILSIQSNQYDKAVERFEKLVSLYPENLKGQFYLGLSYFEAGEKEKARKQFEKVKSLDKDPSVQAAADGYLEEI